MKSNNYIDKNPNPIQPYCHKIYVHNYHLDGYGHVNNARYLEFLEETRWQFFRHYQLLDELKGANLVVSHMDIRYKYPIVRDDEIEIFTEIQSVKSYIIQLNQTVMISGNSKISAIAKVTIVPTQNGKIAKLSETILNKLISIQTIQSRT